MSERVAVTGGAGFIGSRLVEELVRRNYHVIILDDLSTGNIKNLEGLLNKETVEFIQGSITDIPLLNKLFQNVTYVFHQAAIPSVPRSIANPQASHDVNVTGTLNVLIAARDNHVKKMIYASSSSVYGDTPTLPKVEDMIPNPQSPYAVTKLTGEYYCRVFEQVYNLPTVCLRYFNVYGPKQDPESQYAAVIPKFITRVINGQGPVIFGDGEQSRDFTYIKDVIEANVQAAESDATGIFNIGNGKSITINQLAKLTINLLGNYSITPIHEKPRPGDVKDSLADITSAKTFGYSPKYDLEKGLYETVRSFTDGS
ncbi:SDR family oxidoreductase [Chloroflexota bacterium]